MAEKRSGGLFALMAQSLQHPTHYLWPWKQRLHVAAL